MVYPRTPPRAGEPAPAKRNLAALAIVAAAATVAASGCKKDPDAGAVWSAACAGLDDFVLSGWAPAPDDVWFVGGNALEDRGLLLHYDGTRWLSITGVTDKVLWWVSGTTAGDVWAVGEDATALHYSGGLWSDTCVYPVGCNLGTSTCAQDPGVTCASDADCPFVALPTFFGVWGSSSDAVWAVGGHNNPTGPQDVFMFWNGNQWIPGTVDVPSGRTIFKVWGTAADDVWAVGGAGVIFHFTGSVWQATPSPTDEDLISVWGTAPDDVWAVGGASSGVLLHYDGAAWNVVDEAFSPGGMISVWCSPGTTPVVTGYSGFAARIRNGEVDPMPTGIDQALHAVFGDGAGTWAVGGNLATPGMGPGGVILRLGLPTPVCNIEEFAQPFVPTVACGTTVCPGGGGTVSPGDECASGNHCECADNLECWYFVLQDAQTLNHFVCSEECATDADCEAVYGAGACCRIPGPQEVRSFCHSPGFTPIEGDPCM